MLFSNQQNRHISDNDPSISAQEIEVSWYITKDVGDAMIKLKVEGNKPIALTPLQALDVISAISQMTYEANVYNSDNGHKIRG